VEHGHPHSGRGFAREGVEEGGRGVDRAVVDGDDFETAGVILGEQRPKGRRELVFFVAGRDDNRERGRGIAVGEGRLGIERPRLRRAARVIRRDPGPAERQ
jgi:hypothetical protein